MVLHILLVPAHTHRLVPGPGVRRVLLGEGLGVVGHRGLWWAPEGPCSLSGLKTPVLSCRSGRGTHSGRDGGGRIEGRVKPGPYRKVCGHSQADHCRGGVNLCGAGWGVLFSIQGLSRNRIPHHSIPENPASSLFPASWFLRGAGIAILWRGVQVSDSGTGRCLECLPLSSRLNSN